MKPDHHALLTHDSSFCFSGGISSPPRSPHILKIPVVTVAQPERRHPTSHPHIHPHPHRHPQSHRNLPIAPPLRHQPPGLDPKFPVAMANAQSKTRIAQVMKELPFHLGHHIAGGPMAEGGIKAESSLAEPLVGGAKHIVVDEAMANGKAPGLLMKAKLKQLTTSALTRCVFKHVGERTKRSKPPSFDAAAVGRAIPRSSRFGTKCTWQEFRTL